MRADLVVDVALALGACPAEADELRRRALELSAGHPSTATGPVATAAPAAWRSPLPVIVFAVACLGLNLFGNTVAAKFMLPIWLDTIGYAVVATIFIIRWWISRPGDRRFNATTAFRRYASASEW